MNTIKTATRRLTETVRYTVGIDLPVVEDTVLLEPQRLRCFLEIALAGTGRRARVAGTLDRRLACIERQDGRWAVGTLISIMYRDWASTGPPVAAAWRSRVAGPPGP
jgi:hypothetical protein